jgi:hypothetical protein
MSVTGSCLCGRVWFEAILPLGRFVHCHCSRCRKTTGTAHATNAVVKADAFRWQEGEEFVSRDDLPTARSFATSFAGHVVRRFLTELAAVKKLSYQRPEVLTPRLTDGPLVSH